MKILMIGDYKPQVGGPSNVVQNLAHYLSRQHQISVINVEEQPYPTGLGHWFDEIIEVWQEKVSFFDGRIVIPAAIQKAKRALLLRNQVDLCHAHCPSDALVEVINPLKPLVLTLHGYPTLEILLNRTMKSNSLRFRALQWIEKSAIKRADAIIVVGKALKDWVITEFGADPHKVFYIPNGVNVEEFSPISHQKRIDLVKKYNLDNKHCLLFTKHFSPRYGADYLVRALPKIIQKYPNIICVMTNDDPWREDIIALANDLEVRENIIFPGRVNFNELVGLYHASDIYVHPSINDQETFGIALIEAMACERPVVATAVGGPKEIIEGGDNVGILVPPRNPDAIADAVIELLDDPVKAEEIGKNARKYVESIYTWERVCNETLRVYESAIQVHASNFRGCLGKNRTIGKNQ
ncbi:MAG: glycosyltransferase family 4 protein [Methanomicrobiaceae archaeon]|nr:glycosyltransferase family 4 protein [Methanomicrobiaceae archaeon]